MEELCLSSTLRSKGLCPYCSTFWHWVHDLATNVFLITQRLQAHHHIWVQACCTCFLPWLILVCQSQFTCLRHLSSMLHTRDT